MVPVEYPVAHGPHGMHGAARPRARSACGTLFGPNPNGQVWVFRGATLVHPSRWARHEPTTCFATSDCGSPSYAPRGGGRRSASPRTRTSCRGRSRESHGSITRSACRPASRERHGPVCEARPKRGATRTTATAFVDLRSTSHPLEQLARFQRGSCRTRSRPRRAVSGGWFVVGFGVATLSTSFSMAGSWGAAISARQR